MIEQSLESVWTPDLDRNVLLREGTSDRQVWADTFTGRYHVPPPEMPVPRRVLDVGSNIGLTLAHYRVMWPEANLGGVEPSPSNVEMCRLNAPGVPLLAAAVMGREGLGSYDDRVRHEAFQVVMNRTLGGEETSEHIVATRCFTLAQALASETAADFAKSGKLNAEGADFVKLDAEGAEWEILADGNGWAPLVKHLLVELHPGDSYPDDTAVLVLEAVRLLNGLGYYCRTEHAGHPRAIYAWRADAA